MKKVLLDEDVPHTLVPALPQHDVRTVAGMCWRGIKNGALLTLVEGERFDVFVTGDKNMGNQQRLADRPFAVIVLSAINWPVIRPHVPEIADAIDRAEPGVVQTIRCGSFVPRKFKGPSGPSV